MKILVLPAMAFALISLGAVPASAGTLYDNDSGALGFNYSGLTMSAGCCGAALPGDPSGAYNFELANSFSLAASGTVTGVNFWAWETGPQTLTASGTDQVLSVNWSIVANDGIGADAPFTGTVIASGTGTTVTDTFLQANTLYNVDALSFATGPVHLSGGTAYWLILGGPTDTLGYGANGTPGTGIFWDISNGPSTAFQLETVSDTNYSLPIPCQPDVSCTDSESFQVVGTFDTPEPGSMALAGAGVLLMAGLIRRKSIR